MTCRVDIWKTGIVVTLFVVGSPKCKEYRFFHWGCIDIFVYFSHHLVTIPPPTWINAGHLHGVRVLGTLITEWDAGKAVWDQIFESDESLETFVNCLVNICKYVGFDGYLLNVENKLDPCQVEKMENFVKILHRKLHDNVPHAQLIWYDSVTTEGKLKWQNELNNLNRTFFDNCDGIFLNYNWTEKTLLNSAVNAGVRMLDVYVGVDVFGRKCFSGGGFNTWQALKFIQEYKLSVALFAPSWVHETLDPDHFVCLEYIFWKKLWNYLYIHGPSHLPFSTSFCQGYGKRLYHKGKVIQDHPWYNLSKQQYQPSVPSCLNDCCIERSEKPKEVSSEQTQQSGDDALQSEESGLVQKESSCDKMNKGCVQHHNRDAFQGGGCLEIQRLRLLEAAEDLYFHRLLMCDFSCNGATVFVVSTKNNDDDITNLDLMLLIEENTGKYSMKVLYADPSGGSTSVARDYKAFPLQPAEVQDLNEQLPVVARYQPMYSTEGDVPWEVRHYLLNIQGRILEIGATLSGPGNSVLLGYLGIYPVRP
ncbi:cytosolic endo-beta-N-acetylglucosaminidase isoform X2 [Anabrus simplex]|uniref:cytosolic endo-beta-N-acetylglucosaminidase isoform X2 n=1 Tax=Anabrus simplex TaxID=316456 RepID=UPI0035A2E66E